MGLFKRGKRGSGHSDPVASGPAYAAPVHAAPVRAADLTVGDYANGIPNIKLGAIFGSFMRQLVWVIPLMLVGWYVAWLLTADFKRTYTGEATIMVQLGDEYVYQPIAGTDAQSSLMQTPDTITLNEVALIKNPEVMDRVIQIIKDSPGGIKAFAPTIAAKMSGHADDSMEYKLAYMELRKLMDSSFHVAARPNSSIIDLSFKHEDPRRSVSTLNHLIDTYMDYRREIFVDSASEIITQRRADTEAQLNKTEQRISAFLKRNNISDFDSEQQGVSKRTQDLRTALDTLRAQIVETERSLASVEDQLRQTPAEINLYVDDRASNRIAQAELELQQLLAKYLPSSDPVRQKQLEIQELRTLQQNNQGRATGGRRVGPNPVHQDLMRSRNTLQAQADSLREREVTVTAQLNASDGKLRQMTALGPAFNDLLRERETLNNRLKTFLSKEQEALINQQQAESAAENVRVLSEATYPIKGRNMRLLTFAGAAMFWTFTLVMLALFRVFSDPRLYVTPAVPQPGPMPPHQPYAPQQVYAPMQAYQAHPAYPDPHQPVHYSPVSYEPQPVTHQQDAYPPQAYPSAAWADHGQGQAQPQPEHPSDNVQAFPYPPGYEDEVAMNVSSGDANSGGDNPYLSGQAQAGGFR